MWDGMRANSLCQATAFPPYYRSLPPEYLPRLATPPGTDARNVSYLVVTYLMLAFPPPTIGWYSSATPFPSLLAFAPPFSQFTTRIPVVLSDLDRDLLARCLVGMDGAWESFVDRYLPLISHVVSSSARSRLGGVPDEVRDDLIAEIFLELVDNDFAVLRRFRGQSSLGTYLVVVSRRIAVRRLAKMRRVPKSATPPSGMSVPASVTHASPQSIPQPSSSPNGSSQQEWQLENVEEVQQLLAHLPNEEATAIRMFHLEHRSYSDIGTHFGIPENSVGPLLSRARDRMRGLRSEI